jgi:sec-independent protein translocase protein TatA
MFKNGLEPWHIIVIALIVVLLFGSKRLPDAARGLGRSLRIFKSEMKSMKDDDGPETTVTTTTTQTSQQAIPPAEPIPPAAAPPAEPAQHPETPPRVDG